MANPVPDRIIYLFDPLCGWCYGATPALGRLRDAGLPIALVPTGLFSGAGARRMDEGFAAFAWSNDQRIARLSGQPFSEAYRSKVLGAVGSLLDSGPATLALTAVALSAPEREFDALKAIQRARYVDGLDIVSPAVLEDILAAAGFPGAAGRLAAPDAELADANRARTLRGRQLMTALDAQGVPALVIARPDGARLLPANALFGSFDSLVSHLQAA